MIYGVSVTNAYTEALARKKYTPIVAKQLGLRKETFSKIDWKGHSRVLKS